MIGPFKSSPCVVLHTIIRYNMSCIDILCRIDSEPSPGTGFSENLKKIANNPTYNTGWWSSSIKVKIKNNLVVHKMPRSKIKSLI